VKKFILASVSVLLLQSCNSSSNDVISLLPQETQNVTQLASSSDHNPDFVRKLKNKKSYVFKAGVKTNSICGKNDLQHVNDYDGTLGQPVSFVKKHQSAVGALENSPSDSASKFCSGTLIDKNLFLTASHCVDSGVIGKAVAFNYEKSKGSTSLEKQDHYKVIDVLEDGDSSVLDYAIIKLEGNPGEKYGITPIKVEMPEDGHLLTIIQHPKGQPKQVESGPKVGVSGVYMSYADLDTEPGSSGSGVLNKDGFLVGVHTNGGCSSSGGANKGVLMTEIAKKSKIVQQLAVSSSLKIRR
jgi:V8-like Glu-specific endopeptidase